MEVVPVSYFIQNLAKTYINLNHHGLGPKGVKAIAIALVSNATVTHLELEDNCILGEGAICIAEMLKENSSLQELVPNVMQFVAKIIAHQVQSSERKPIQCHYDFNQVTVAPMQKYSHSESHGNFLRLQLAGRFSLLTFVFLQGNYRVKELDLSHNEFNEKGGQLLGQMLASNATLEILDLSWNHLRRKGTVALGTGLRDNGALKILNLSWNGIGNEGALALGEALRANDVLVHLDISNNQINNEGAKKLCRGLEVNGKLKILKMANNPLTVEGATALVKSVRKNSNSMMEEINISTNTAERHGHTSACSWSSHPCFGASWEQGSQGPPSTFGSTTIKGKSILTKISLGVHVDCTLLPPMYQNVLVNETFIKLLDLVCQTRPELEVIYGEVEGCIAKISKQHPNPMKVIRSYLKEHNLQLWDFFRRIDKDGNMKIPVAAFRRAMMQQSSIPLDRVQIGELVRKLDRNRTGVVDYR
ncbi:Uncharacterized protein C14orf166B [Pterocles gutturalis]|uniref:Uncharacterized protein C14orf166B n=1 Tax=Pterocles gutturalis TaxID=240206 RepID=A0AAW3DNA5_9AVES|nr:Uncharacterized protein C14orf166B [Pterocles gutturalis]